MILRTRKRLIGLIVAVIALVSGVFIGSAFAASNGGWVYWPPSSYCAWGGVYQGDFGANNWVYFQASTTSFENTCTYEGGRSSDQLEAKATLYVWYNYNVYWCDDTGSSFAVNPNLDSEALADNAYGCGPNYYLTQSEHWAYDGYWHYNSFQTSAEYYSW